VSTSSMVAAGDQANRDQYFAYLKQFRSTQHPFGDSSKRYDELIGFIDDQVKFVGIRARMTMELLEPYKVKNPIEDRAKKFVKTIQKPDTARSVFAWTWDWTWSPSQEGTITGMTLGMSIAFPIAFVTLLLATHNVILSFFAILSVGSIVANTLGMCQFYLGWYLGTAEAIAGVMVIGLAVDYTIHLGHMYDHGSTVGLHSREEKFAYAIEKMALTVIAGAITTAGAGIFMFACQSTFFPKMATLISGTVIFSIIYSLLFFMPLLSLVGPEGDFGRIPFHKLFDTCSRKDKSNDPDDEGESAL